MYPKPSVYFQSLLLFVYFLIGVPALTAQTVTYTESTEDFTNPDRGFYTYSETSASNYRPLNLSTLIANQAGYTSGSANYTVKPSLVFRYFVLDDFYQGGNITASFLTNLQADFDIARAGGVRLIIRFTYNISPNTSCGQAACRPYLDATKSAILNHIAQLKPYLQDNADVIAAVQMGFIGVWGEQYYSTYFGDTSPNVAPESRYYTNENWDDRNDILAAILDATPSNRMVQVRYPQLKQRFLEGPTAPVTTNAITESQAHKATDIARIGFHNDCFLAATDDFGTYFDYGNDASFPSNQIDILKPYFANDSRFVAVGGETCGDGFSPQNDCGGQTLSDMADLHYSYLNADFNNDVNNDWQDGGCMEEIKQKLGYRLVMKNGTYPNTQAAGTSLNFTLNIENVGFAAPFNERTLFLVLKATSDGTVTKLPVSGTNTDTRFWHTGMISLDGTVQLPTNLPQGNYDLLLHIADTSNSNRVIDRPAYSIRLANNNTWESATGYNQLNHQLSITDNTATTECILIDGNFSDWTAAAAISTNGSGGLTTLKANDDTGNLYLFAGNNIDANYQFYLDTDNNNSGGNEFTGSSWANTGFNYLVENGLLYEYTGTGTDFTWRDIGEVVSQKTANGVEVAIAKSRLSGLSTTIQIGFGHLNANWSETGKIPNVNTGSTYNLTAMDCSCGEENLTLSGLLTTSKVYETNGEITSTETISGNGSVVYDTGASITLKNGFSVSSGADFHAFIDGCGTTEEAVFEEVITAKALGGNAVLTEEPIKLAVAPNPFQGHFSINYSLAQSGIMSLTIYDILGKVLMEPLVANYQEIGIYEIDINGNDLEKGLYFVVLKVDNQIVTKKLIKK